MEFTEIMNMHMQLTACKNHNPAAGATHDNIIYTQNVIGKLSKT